MHLDAFKFRSSRGLSLVEWLVVITIVAILARIALPLVNITLDNSRKSRAKLEMKSLVVAIEGFHTEYHRYPVIGLGQDDEVIDTTDPRLLRVIMAKEQDGAGKLNFRDVRFYEPPVRKGSAGFHPDSGKLYDPFGQGIGYRVQMDYDGDGKIRNPYDRSKFVHARVIVYSSGSNGVWNLSSIWQSKTFDDVKSWE